MKFINAILYVIASSYSMSELKIVSKKIAANALANRQCPIVLGKMALLPLFGERFALIILHP